jgi:excisionase family DNA binding protein
VDSSSESLSASEAAKLAGVSRSTLIRWAQEGLIPSFRAPDGHDRFSRKEIEAASIWIKRKPGKADP